MTRKEKVSFLYLKKKLDYVAKGQGMFLLLNVSVAAGHNKDHRLREQWLL